MAIEGHTSYVRTYVRTFTRREYAVIAIVFESPGYVARVHIKQWVSRADREEEGLGC